MSIRGPLANSYVYIIYKLYMCIRGPLANLKVKGMTLYCIRVSIIVMHWSSTYCSLTFRSVTVNASITFIDKLY